jgi:hypothetical protein
MVLMGYSGARGTLIYEKNLKVKISCQTPFKSCINTFLFFKILPYLSFCPDPRPVSYHCPLRQELITKQKEHKFNTKSKHKKGMQRKQTKSLPQTGIHASVKCILHKKSAKHKPDLSS